MNTILCKSKKLANLIPDSIYFADFLEKKLVNPVNSFQRYFYLMKAFDEISKTNSFLHKKLKYNFFDPAKNLQLFISSLTQPIDNIDTKNDYHQLFFEWKQNYQNLLKKNDLDDPLLQMNLLFDMEILGTPKPYFNNVLLEKTENIEIVEFASEKDLELKLDEIKMDDHLIFWSKKLPNNYENPFLLAIYHFLLAILTKNKNSISYIINNSLFPSISDDSFTKEALQLEKIADVKELLLEFDFADFTDEVVELLIFLSQSKYHIKTSEEITQYLDIFMLNYQNISNIFTFDDGFYPINKPIIVVDEILAKNPFLIQKTPSIDDFLPLFLQNQQKVIIFLRDSNLELKNKLSKFNQKTIKITKNHKKILKINQNLSDIAIKSKKTIKNYNLFLKYLNQCSYKAFCYQMIDFLPKTADRKLSHIRNITFSKVYDNIWQQVNNSSKIKLITAAKISPLLSQEISYQYRDFPYNFQKKETNFLLSFIQKTLLKELELRKNQFEVSTDEIFIFSDNFLTAGRLDTENGEKILVKYNFSAEKKSISYLPELLNPNLQGLIIYNFYPEFHIMDLSDKIKKIREETLEITTKNLVSFKSPSPSSKEAFVCENCFARIICKNPKA